MGKLNYRVVSQEYQNGLVLFQTGGVFKLISFYGTIDNTAEAGYDLTLTEEIFNEVFNIKYPDEIIKKLKTLGVIK